jgi:hypothetical protein
MNTIFETLIQKASDGVCNWSKTSRVLQQVYQVSTPSSCETPQFFFTGLILLAAGPFPSSDDP